MFEVIRARNATLFPYARQHNAGRPDEPWRGAIDIVMGNEKMTVVCQPIRTESHDAFADAVVEALVLSGEL